MYSAHPFDRVYPIAQRIVTSLAPYCDRIEIAGSLRRGRLMVGDIEIVALPKRPVNLFGEPDLDAPTELDMFLGDSQVEFSKNGRKYKQFRYGRYMVDLFLPASAAHWGSIFMIRTGSHEFNMWLMKRVAPRANVLFSHGRLFVRSNGVDLETPEESDVFKALGLPFIPLDDRDEERWLRYAEQEVTGEHTNE